MSKRAVDVFLSAPPSAAGLAFRIADTLHAYGLDVFTLDRASARLTDQVRDAIAEAGAVVVIINPDSLRSPSIMFELGAAFGWNKAVFPVLDGVAPSELPPLLRESRAFDQSSLAKLATDVLAAIEPLSTEDEEALASLYAKWDCPLDELLQRPAKADRFIQAFNRGRRSKLGGEQVLRALLRLRKTGKLPRTRR
jgi:hypothetical protein